MEMDDTILKIGYYFMKKKLLMHGIITNIITVNADVVRDTGIYLINNRFAGFSIDYLIVLYLHI